MKDRSSELKRVQAPTESEGTVVFASRRGDAPPLIVLPTSDFDLTSCIDEYDFIASVESDNSSVLPTRQICDEVSALTSPRVKRRRNRR